MAVPSLVATVTVMASDDGLERVTAKVRVSPSPALASAIVTDGASSSSTIEPIPVSDVSPTGPPVVEPIDAVRVSVGSSIESSVVATTAVPEVAPAGMVMLMGPAA